MQRSPPQSPAAAVKGNALRYIILRVELRTVQFSFTVHDGALADSWPLKDHLVAVGFVKGTSASVVTAANSWDREFGVGLGWGGAREWW